MRWHEITAYLAAWIRTPSGWWGEIHWVGIWIGGEQGQGTAAMFSASVHHTQLRPIAGQDYRRVPRR